MKRFWATILAALMMLSLAACGGDNADTTDTEDTGDSSTEDTATDGEAACEPLTIKMYNAVAGQTVDGTLIPKTIELLEEYSNGAITVDLIPAGTLGAEKEAVQLLQMGDIDMLPLSIDGVDFGTPDVNMNWTSLPYLLTSWEDVDSEYNNGWMLERHREVAAEYGIDIIENIDNGLKSLIGTGKAPTSITDLAGKIVRTPDIPIFHYYYKQLGLTTVSGIDQYTGLQQGTMDCITNSPWAMNVFHLEEVADWIYVTAESWGTMYWTANLDWTSSLTDAQRDIVYRAAKEAALITRQEIRDTCDSYLEKAAEAGVEVVYPDEASIEIMKEAAYKTWTELRDDFDPVAMDRLFADYLPEEFQ